MWGEIVLEKIKNLTKKQKIIIASVAGVLVITTIVVLLFVFLKPEKETKPAIESIKIEQPKKKEKEKKGRGRRDGIRRERRGNYSGKRSRSTKISKVQQGDRCSG